MIIQIRKDRNYRSGLPTSWKTRCSKAIIVKFRKSGNQFKSTFLWDNCVYTVKSASLVAIWFRNDSIDRGTCISPIRHSVLGVKKQGIGTSDKSRFELEDNFCGKDTALSSVDDNTSNRLKRGLRNC